MDQIRSLPGLDTRTKLRLRPRRPISASASRELDTRAADDQPIELGARCAIPGVIPPLWHRHAELIWELSALHQHWLSAYDPKQHGSAPIGWHRDFADARQRLHDWVAACGTRLDSDRPTRQAAWPGEDPAPAVEESAITNRDEDFVQFVRDDIVRRRAAEDAFYAQLAVDH